MKDTNRNLDLSDMNQSQGTHNFHPLDPDSREINQGNVEMIETEEKVYNKNKISETRPKMSSNQTIFGGALMMTNMCLGTTIFTFAAWTKSFGLLWIIVSCFLVAAIDYWSIMNCAKTSSKIKEDDFSEATEKVVGKKARVLLNILIIVYSYACMITFYVLIFSLFGRFIHNVAYRNYPTYNSFYEARWGKLYIKYPFSLGLAFVLSLISLIKDIKKLNFSAYIGVGAVIYTLFVIMIECNKYYEHYKNNVFKKEDKNTHLNIFDLRKGFTSDLNFFKGIACIFGAYSCHTGVFPVFSGFKYQESGIKKMKYSVFFCVCLTTSLHIISIVCSYLTDPITPEDVVIYRKPLDNGKDIPMTISKLLITLSLIFTLPGYFFGLRLSIANSFTGGNISTLFNIIFTFGSMFICAIIGALYDKILNYLSYIGGFITVFICYLYPSILYVYSSGKPLTYWRNLLDIIFACFLCIIGVIAGIRTIIDDVNS